MSLRNSKAVPKGVPGKNLLVFAGQIPIAETWPKPSSRFLIYEDKRQNLKVLAWTFGILIAIIASCFFFLFPPILIPIALVVLMHCKRNKWLFWKDHD